MSSIAYRSTLTGVLNRVMVVVLLGCVGLTAGVAFGTLFSSSEIRETFVVPAHTLSASDLVRMERGTHPAVRVVAHGRRVIELSTPGHRIDADEDWSALCIATLSPDVGPGGPACAVPLHPSDPRLALGGYVLFGLLAGLSAALGFLVPPRSRVTAAH
jgi:hypothetical protein